ncbi:uncharacterized protein F5Z01DRAFT_715498 [Emericellopsis atlantica]|uniref:Mid2 domain-containing protein n=1 Tax=Emericellopsis atlantica TaxID=2614577 RepID=A0A9P8CJQ5_9HYPO|nr:uncharacterized protein F5Z01DRAFT_715498 [Emericellopsis atlantica]KAG9249719.1 hypothetical protein F5Z01DRAFT_715498 [Emericellopsis atlantica]
MSSVKTIGQALLPLCLLHTATADNVKLDSTRVNSGPLTKTFTPPSTCLEEFITTTSGPFTELRLGCQGPAGDECCPTGWASNRYFSPGVCPLGYQACTLPTTTQRDETTNLCCPSGFDCVTDLHYATCHSLLQTPEPFPYSWNGTTGTLTVTWVTATAIQIRFKASDSDIVPIPTASFSLPGKPMSMGVKAGIGVGATVGTIALLVGLCCGIRKYRSRRQRAGGMISSTQGPSLLDSPSEVPLGTYPDDNQAPPLYTRK